MTDETTRGRGRPKGSTTGTTPLRTAKIGVVWDRGQELAAKLAEREGRKPNMTTYVEEAIREKNARVEKLLGG